MCSSYLCGLNIIQIIEKVAQLSATSDPVSGHAESVCKDRACYIAECQNSNIQFTILTVICLSHVTCWRLSSLEFPLHLASCPGWSSGPTSSPSMQPVYVGVEGGGASAQCNQCMWGWRGRSQCSGQSQAQVQRVLCLSLGPRPSSPQQQMD